MDSALSIKNASGKTFSLLNDNTVPFQKLSASFTTPKRKYHCNELGCNKSFTTSGHLARHHRIHTGEKNFHCLHPGCPSRFSRQDNMMQHYRTHLSQKARRQQARPQQRKKGEPQLYRHSFHGPEDQRSFQPLMQRSRRAVTMPSMPYSPATINRPRRTLSTSSTCSSDSSSFTYSPPQQPILLPLPFVQRPQPMYQQEQTKKDWSASNDRLYSNLLQLANIVSTFG